MPALLKRQPFKAAQPSGRVFATDPEFSDPTLRARYQAAAAAIGPAFAEADTAAVREQAKFRRLRVLLLILAMLTGAFGALQAVWSSSFVPGLVVAIIGLMATAISQYERHERPGEKYVKSRSKTERLRALHFRAIGTELGDRATDIERAVLEIEDGEAGA